MTKFKYGDKVQVVESNDSFYTGVKGIVTYYDQSAESYDVRLDHDIKSFHEYQLKKLKGGKNGKNTRVTKRN